MFHVYKMSNKNYKFILTTLFSSSVKSIDQYYATFSIKKDTC